MSVYLVMYSTEICIGAALLLGLGIGALVAYNAGRERGTTEGFDDGYSWGRAIGFKDGQKHRYQRDAKGRFTK